MKRGNLLRGATLPFTSLHDFFAAGLVATLRSRSIAVGPRAWKSPETAIAATPAPTLRSAWRYDHTSIALHWLMALLITAIAILGWIMVEIEKNPGSARYFNLHKSLGLVIALLVAARLAWRLTHRAETLPATVPMWQRKLSLATQLSLYGLMFLVPLTGYLGASYSKAGVSLFGLSTPRWALPNHDISEQIFDIHSALVWVLVTVVVIHALGALKHLLLDKDQVFQRMWFQRRR